MKIRAPIYNLFHQEIKACANHLLEMSQNQEFSPDDDVGHVLNRLLELHQFASKVRAEEHYHSLSELKHYLENTMLCYQDEQERLQSIRLSEAISLLTLPSSAGFDFKPAVVKSLTAFFLRHFLQESKPGKPLFKKLVELKKL